MKENYGTQHVPHSTSSLYDRIVPRRNGRSGPLPQLSPPDFKRAGAGLRDAFLIKPRDRVARIRANIDGRSGAAARQSERGAISIIRAPACTRASANAREQSAAAARD